MSVSVRVPTQLRNLTDGRSDVEATGASVSEVLADLERSHPGVLERVVDEGGVLRRFVNIYLDDENVRFLDGLQTSVAEGDVLSIIPAVAGGS